MKIKKSQKYIGISLGIALLIIFIFHFTEGVTLIGNHLYTPRDFFTDSKSSQLALAVERGGDVKKIQKLIDEGADVNVIGKNGTSMLNWALITSKKNDQAVIVLLKNGANPNYIPPKGTDMYGLSVTYFLAESPRTGLLKVVLEHGGNPDIRNPDENNKTALMVAAEEGPLENVKLLVEHSADINARDDKGLNALFHAVENRQFEKAYYLLEHGADYRISGYKYASLTQSSFLQELSDSRNWGFNEQGEAERAKVLQWFSDRNIKLPPRSYENPVSK